MIKSTYGCLFIQYLILPFIQQVPLILIADFWLFSAEHGEGLQILHYEVGQKYEPHFDYFQDEFNTKMGARELLLF